MTLKQIGIDVTLPAARALVRYCPWQPARRFAWDRCVSPFYAWRDHRFEAKTDFGATMAGNTGDLIQKYVYYFGSWEPNISRWIASRLNPGDTFVDVGANVGYFSLLAASRTTASGRVIAIEACPEIFAQLQDNCRRNSYTNIRAINVAASDQPGTLRLYRGGNENGGSTTTIATAEGGQSYSDITALPLSGILSPEECSRMRLIKIDVEGAEYNVLKGAAPIFEHAPQNLEILVELHPTLLAAQNKTIKDVFQLMSSHGFHVYCFPDFCSTGSYFNGTRPVQLQRMRRPSDVIESVVFSRVDRDHL
ncbi:MAG: FkbM family methyltransferase [Acidobacteriaceae bacterium]|nr:FkbM family methyltransferase [Acidobacteriaceae bacterium]